jgi:hypothetical protein
MKTGNFHILAKIFPAAAAKAATAAGIAGPDGVSPVVFIHHYEFMAGDPGKARSRCPSCHIFASVLQTAQLQDSEALETLFGSRLFIVHLHQGVELREYHAHFVLPFESNE